ncbi:MAG: GNAT family N-acetyltransferase [Patescibacteria group bacterium]
MNLYKEVFAGPPYFESYTDEYVEHEVWNKHLENDGQIFLALAPDGSVIGFGCVLPAKKSWESGEFLEENRHRLPFELETACYMSEIGVHADYRKRGIGTSLIQARVECAKKNGFDTYVMRTALEGSNSKNMYENFGAKIIEGLIQNVSEHAKEVSSKSEFRMYLYGNC